VFLFDEPLSNLDAELRVEMRIEIARLHKEIGATMIYVTHDQVEAMTLADKIVVLRSGRIEQVGAPLELYRNPDNKFVAGFIGSPSMNFLNGTVQGGSVHIPALDVSVTPPVTLPAEGSNVIVGVRPEHIGVDATAGSQRVDMAEALGGVSYLYVTGETGERITVESHGDEVVTEGETIGISLDDSRVMLFDAETEARIR
jgi:lactose/L-arabinose transport system ATP-binding protein